MLTLESLRAIYTKVETVRKPNREVSPFMIEYLNRKGEIHKALEANLDVPKGLIVDEMPEDTELPTAVQAQMSELQEWLDQQKFKEIPQEVQAQLAKLEAVMKGL